MTNINNNLNQLYSLWQTKNDLTTQKKTAKGKEKTQISSELSATDTKIKKLKKETNLFDITGDQKFDYRDIVEFAKGVDIDGDGTISKTEMDFINDMTKDILNNYKVKNDTALKSANMSDLTDFLSSIEGLGDIFSSKDKLDEKLEEINENLNKNILGTDTNNTINQNNVTVLVNLEVKRDAAKAFLAGEMNEENAKLLFGSEVNKIDDTYIKDIENAIKSIQNQIGIPDGDISSLSKSKKNSYNKYRNKCTAQTWEQAALKQRLIKTDTDSESYYFKNIKTKITYDYDITGDGIFDYKDILVFAQGDLDGDGKISDAETAVMNELMNDILKKYKTNNDTALKNADLDDLTNFMSVIENRGDIFASENNLDKKLEEINENLNRNLFGTESKNSITKKNVQILAQLETKLQAANSYLAGNTDKASAILIFGAAEINNINEEYIKTLEMSIKSIQQQIGIQNGNTDALSKSNKKNYDKFYSSANFTYNYDVTGDGKFDYKDLLALAKGDIDGDGQISDTETNLINEHLDSIIKSYNINKDDALKTADIGDLSEFISKTKELGNIYTSENKLDMQLEEVNERLNKNIFDTESNNNITKKNVQILAKQENKLNVAKAMLAGEVDEKIAKLFLGYEYALVNAEYVKDLETSIKSIQQQMGIENGTIDSLSDKDKKSYNKYHSTVGTTPSATNTITWEEAAAKEEQRIIDELNEVIDSNHKFKDSVDWAGDGHTVHRPKAKDRNGDDKFTLDDAVVELQKDSSPYLSATDMCVKNVFENLSKDLLLDLGNLCNYRDVSKNLPIRNDYSDYNKTLNYVLNEIKNELSLSTLFWHHKDHSRVQVLTTIKKYSGKTQKELSNLLKKGTLSRSESDIIYTFEYLHAQWTERRIILRDDVWGKAKIIAEVSALQDYGVALADYNKYPRSSYYAEKLAKIEEELNTIRTM